MGNLEFKKPERRVTMSISIDPDLRKAVIMAAEKEGISVSSFAEQAIRFVLSEKTKNKE